MAELPVECFIDNDEEVLRLHGWWWRARFDRPRLVCLHSPQDAREAGLLASDGHPSKVPCKGHHLTR
jgi:hypothetical protein